MKEKKVYCLANVVEITSEALFYIDENEVKSTISFSKCRSNWVAHINKSRNYVDSKGEPVQHMTESDTDCVGIRDWYSEKPYFEFCEDEIVRFEIVPKKNFF